MNTESSCTTTFSSVKTRVVWGVDQRLDALSLMIASHLRVGECLVLDRRHHNCAGDDGATDAKQGSRLDQNCDARFVLVFDVGLGQIGRCRLRCFWKDSKCRCFEADLWNLGFELLSGPNENLDDLLLQISKCC